MSKRWLRAPALLAATLFAAGCAVTRPPAQVRFGSGQVINQRAAAAPAPGASGAGEATFNFEGESLHAVVKAILGDLLQQNYVIAPNVQGTVTLSTPRAVSPAECRRPSPPCPTFRNRL